MSFSSQVKKGAEQYMVDAMKIVKGEFNRIGSNIIRDTAVDTGKLRNNWSASFVAPAQGVNRDSDGYAGTGGGKDSKESLKSVVDKIDKEKVGKNINFTNCLSYAEKIENGGFDSAPEGFLAKNVFPSKEVFK